jgi:hypothetical protein
MSELQNLDVVRIQCVSPRRHQTHSSTCSMRTLSGYARSAGCADRGRAPDTAQHLADSQHEDLVAFAPKELEP